MPQCSICWYYHFTLSDAISGSYFKEVEADLLEVKVVFDLTKSSADLVGLKFRGTDREETVITYSIPEQKLMLNCSKFR
ncbi:GH32 C-terminal domain-containing protein [Paenibacillus sp. 8b26]|uniref:GH32 C-terminal domain-containing protein n=1 Tax=Paenibacillus sp. 8b26 TaxID=3424133 RepID=UPI003D648952